MSHYETLDIPSTASSDEVKQAFRRKASAAHPDRGGDADAMSAINRAYETLGDPERRARYDETGSDQAEKPVEAEAREMLLTLFNAAVTNSDDNWLREVSAMLQKHQAQVLSGQNQMQAKLARMVKRTGKIRVKAGENLVQMLIDQQVKGLKANIAAAARALVINKTAAAMLTAYELDEESVPAYTQQQHAIDQQQIAYGAQANPFGGWFFR